MQCSSQRRPEVTVEGEAESTEQNVRKHPALELKPKRRARGKGQEENYSSHDAFERKFESAPVCVESSDVRTLDHCDTEETF